IRGAEGQAVYLLVETHRESELNAVALHQEAQASIRVPAGDVQRLDDRLRWLERHVVNVTVKSELFVLPIVTLNVVPRACLNAPVPPLIGTRVGPLEPRATFTSSASSIEPPMAI